MQFKTDIIIFGGGIAGLWLLNRLSNAGYSTLLLENQQLGGGQTLVSQGMIHGGLKYALAGALNDESEAIAAMPDRWRRCLTGEDAVDLSQAKVLSDVFYMWSGASLASRFTGFAASKALRGRIDKLKKDSYPDFFQAKGFKGNVYKLHDPVLDTHSLLKTLLTPWQQQAYTFDGDIKDYQEHSDGCDISLNNDGERVDIRCKQIISTAGKGTEDLLKTLGYQAPRMQLRPLHQVAVSSPTLKPLYAHALGLNSAPRMTISSHQRDNSHWVWFLGGDLSTNGIDRDAQSQIEYAKTELQSLMPWHTLNDADWRTVRVDRAEPKQQSLIKPDDVFAEYAADSTMVCWPTKLTLAPRLGDRVVQLLNDKSISASAEAAPKLPLKPAVLAEKPWNTLFD